jgi:hypothetical protein
MNKKAIAIEGLIAAAAIVVAVVIHQVSEQWATALAVGLFSEILLQVFRFRAEYGTFLSALAEGHSERDHPFDLLSQLSSHAIPLTLLTNPPSEPIFRTRFDDLVTELHANLKALDRGHFVVPMEDVQDVSFEVSDSLENSAFCTAPQENLEIFMSRRGGELKESNFKAASRLESKGGFARLFIFDNLSSIKWRYLQLMEENHKRGVNVLVALTADVEEALKKHYWEERSDFGLWDDKYLITIRNINGGRMMEVSKDESLLKAARKVINELKEVAWGWEDFWHEFIRPRSEQQWSTTPERLLELSSPNGPSSDDCDAMRESALETLQPGDTVAIYGLTKPLSDSVRSIEDVTCHVVDCRLYNDGNTGHPAEFIRANWLEWIPQTPYHVVLGDDVIPNLGLWQIPLFFRNLYRAMAPGGRFITRTSAMYSPDTIHPSWAESLNKLRMFDPSNGTHVSSLQLDDLHEGVVYEVAWPALHGEEFYDPQCGCIDLGAWDKKLSAEADDTDFLGKVRLPYQHVITSLDYGQLKELALPYFQIVDEQPVHCAWESEDKLQAAPGAKDIASRFSEYYRILVFERLSPNGTLGGPGAPLGRSV